MDEFDDEFTPATASQAEGDGAETEQAALQQLKLKWQAEKASPEILPYCGDLVDAVHKQTQSMEDRINLANPNPQKTLEVQLMTMDLDRARFVLRSYLRCRIGKIDKFFLQMFSDADVFERLSKAEQDYCERSIKFTQKHMDQSVLNRMPARYSNMIKQSDTSPQPDMIPEADLDVFVFCKATRLLEDVQLDPQADDTVTLQPGELHVLHFRPVRQLVEDGAIKLI